MRRDAPARDALVLAGVLAVSGALHFAAPRPFDAIVPRSLPGPARTWTYLSGAAELAVAAAVGHPRTRRLGGLAAAGLFAAVFPANVQMALDWRGAGPARRAIAFGRLPLQVPLVLWGSGWPARAGDSGGTSTAHVSVLHAQWVRDPEVRPTGEARTFAENEIIVTKTDTRGVLTYANDVFLRLSALTEEEAIGQPHSLIRHPDMPRTIFKLLWDTLKEQKEIFAYVVNLASDGAHYWVFAHVTPSYDSAKRVTGYHSNRRRPEPSAVAAASELYARLRAEERRHSSSPAGLDASWALLHRILEERGHTYDTFVWELTNGVNA